MRLTDPSALISAMKTTGFCACLLTRLQSFGLARQSNPGRHCTTTNELHPFTPPKCAHHKVWLEKIFRPARNIAASYGHATKRLQCTDVFPYNNGVISLRTILPLAALKYARSPSTVGTSFNVVFTQFWTYVRCWTRETAGTCGIPTSWLATSVITTPPLSPF